MTDNGADFTLTFRRLVEVVEPGAGDAVDEDTATDAANTATAAGQHAVRSLFIDTAGIDTWLERWRVRLAAEAGEPRAVADAMRRVNPIYIPRNHRVEAVIRAAEDRGDFAPLHELVDVLARPYDERPGLEKYAAPPEDHERVLRTFCGT
jgi:serine/tyrosine/threonine adenylyltransferase